MGVPSFFPVMDCKLAFLGEAPGREEEIQNTPFVGASGKELGRCCSNAGILFSGCARINVFSVRPPGNNVRAFTRPKREMPKDYTLPPLQQGAYVLPEYLELDRVKADLERAKPNLAVALGNTALWALCGTTGIAKYRGSIMESTLVPGLKVLPTYHPAAILRAWDLRVVLLADLMKAARECEYPEIIRPQRTLYIRPTREDLDEWRSVLMQSEFLSIDLETRKQRYVTCICFCPSSTEGYVVPFVDSGKPDFHYWQNAEDEVAAWQLVRDVCQNLKIKKLGQNFLYDIQHLFFHGIKVMGYEEDTMLKHHAHQPEMKKSLGFLGSIYTNEASWKTFNTKGEKREDV